jgi:tetratricopeptide (TPR) repeat protein
MKLYSSTLSIDGAHLEGENPLPVFRDKNHNKAVIENGSFKTEHMENFGYETGERSLPYCIQDRYTRDRKSIILKTLILENDILQAVFLPDYGGRLYSLKDKRTNKDILYKNPVFQPANLAIRNAWFSGGIEWNIGQLGHTFTTCSPVHAAKLHDENNHEFLRIYDYERCKNVFWQIDFHLPKGSDKLLVYVRIVNDNSSKVPMYWWTNIALKETTKARVFSSTPEVIYMDQKIKGFGVDEMPYLPTAANIDASYPLNIPFSSEYFFQTTSAFQSPWEALAYEDGDVFFERSTELLRYRKMFCWGNHAGGRRWCDFLAKPGEGNYIEVQGGLSPTQLHGIDMPCNTVWDFTQIFGTMAVNTDLSHQDSWKNACKYIEENVDYHVCAEDVYKIHEKLQTYCSNEPDEILSLGSGWGALEKLRRQKVEARQLPDGFRFEDTGLSTPQYPWLALLQEGYLPETSVSEIPSSWMVQAEWLTLLETSLGEKSRHTWNAFMHYGVMLYENGEEENAIAAWEHSIAIKPSAWVYRNLSEAMKRKGLLDKALYYFENAYDLEKSFPDRAFTEEYLDLLIKCGEFEKAWKVYTSLPASLIMGDRIKIIMGTAACELGYDEYMINLFNTEFAVIREGESSIIELWYKYNAKMLAKESGLEMSDELLKEAMTLFAPPTNIDFRMIGN